MRRLLPILVLISLLAGTGCAGCGPLHDVDDNARSENGGTHIPHDGGEDLGSGAVGESDFAGTPDGGPEDLDRTTDGGPEDLGGAADGGPGDLDVGSDGGGPGDLGGGLVCGDGVVERTEVCDDGVTTDCHGTHDGGDGVCRVPGECSDTFVYDGATCVPAQITQHVHIYVANDCSMMVDPPELTVPRGQTVRFSWHNHSQSYPVDVWQSYIGGFTDLAPGMTWNEQFEWCFNVNPYTGYSDISTNASCPDHRFFIRCNGR